MRDYKLPELFLTSIQYGHHGHEATWAILGSVFICNIGGICEQESDFFYTPACLGRSGAYSVSPWCYICMCICQVHNQMSNLTCKFTCKFYIHICVPISLGAHNLDYHHAIPFKFGMILSFKFMLELPLGHAPGWGQGSKCITGQGHLCTLDTCLVFLF